MRWPLWVVVAVAWLAAPAQAHDIPNARVDRSIQVIVAPGRLRINYEVSLAELTLTQDLRSLIGPLPDALLKDWYARYGEETGPLNAKGFLVTVDGRPLEIQYLSYALLVEEHPRFTYRFEAPLPSRGRLRVSDTNFAAAEGTSRLAVRGEGAVAVTGDDLPGDVALIPARPVWQLSDAEETRTRLVEVEFAQARRGEVPKAAAPPAPPARTGSSAKRPSGLLGLLDRTSGVSIFGLALLAFFLGAAHAAQPGHGKTLVAATVAGERGGWLRGALLSLITTAVHMGSVLLVALGLWLSRSTRYADIDAGLIRCAGFVIAATGLWRLGRYLAGHGEHDAEHDGRAGPGSRGLVGLGIAGGILPCWDGVGLIVLAEAVGRLSLGVGLLAAFSLGMWLVLTAVGWLTVNVRRILIDRRGEGPWGRRLGIVSSGVLSGIGLYLLR